MRSFEDIGKEDLRDLLGKGWLTHDGAWFYNTAAELGISAANRLNKAAIRTQAPFEVQRLKRVLGVDEVEQFEDVRDLLLAAMRLILPESVFSKFELGTPERNVLRWHWQSGECFAYKGISQIGLIHGYECGVIYRIECWFDALGIACETEPHLDKCIMHSQGACSGSFNFEFPARTT